MKCLITLMFYVVISVAKPQFGFKFSPFQSFGILDDLPLNGEINELKSGIQSMEPRENVKGLKTSTKTTRKGNMKITDTNKTGKNFFYRVVETTGGSKGPIGDSLLLNGMPLRDMLKKNNCKNCDDESFCNYNGDCEKKGPEGATCLSKGECQKKLNCVWGVCNEGDDGEAGTSCEKKDDCSDDLFCMVNVAMGGEKGTLCMAKLTEGAVCGEGFFGEMFNMLPIQKKKKKNDNPCVDGLKCSTIGVMGKQVCVSEDFKAPKTIAQADIDNDESSGDENNDDDKDDGKIKVTTTDGTEMPDSTKKGKKKKEDRKSAGKKEKSKKGSKHIKFQA